ncbi:DNA primase [Loa loa]|uniref:DNA primase n=1 Tax=Loa loa TaxID=7209 RepID=A0A1I7VTF5_LOALO|nr:DNA primase [Loa loa]EFO25443.1 DNA primase [Loa loa]
MADFDRSLLQQTLPEYYRRLFPFGPLSKWLTYGKDLQVSFQMRELAFIFEDDRHVRYRSFEDSTEFERELCKANPQKIDIGAVYNYKPKDHKKFANFRPVERELIFDIDLTDYDDIRTCCSKAKICRKCWRWICIAVGVLDHLLQRHFGFKHCLWVFSGRRGIHCWVADAAARKLQNAGRMAVVEYLSLITGGQKVSKAATKRTFVHPMLEDVYSYLVQSSDVSKLMLEQGWMSNNGLMSLLDGCVNEEVEKEITEIIDEVKNVDCLERRWNALRIKFDKYKRAELKKNGIELCEVASLQSSFHFRGYVLQHAYPRLDVHVSVGINHLLKSPFCVHPETGLIAVPIKPDQISDVNFAKLPRIDTLLHEILKLHQIGETKKDRRNFEIKHCSLGPYVETFENFVNNLIYDEQQHS